MKSKKEVLLSKKDVAKDTAEQPGTSKQTENLYALTEVETSDDETYIRPESEDDEETTGTSNGEENCSREEERNTTETGSEKETPDDRKMTKEKKKIEPEKMLSPKEMEKPTGKGK